ncbi:hypothetical protein GLOIN_2v1791318 [Rhizophagus clarus]|uniref:Uncharacterized protein n=1 Tax=Rhizophagus clarus TaxID=94130 RepID=A0A8H3MHH4_9GLOM|nr:hypothetical protein GLOIN_2v1791318 [Rhizophagus clarus]
MKKCPGLKYFDMRSIKHQIFYFPGAKACLESLCELKCDTSIHHSYFYELSQSCQHIQRLIIDKININPNHGIVKLIEVQRNLKYFEWNDVYNEYMVDHCEDIFLALGKKVLPKFFKLKTLISDDYISLIKELEQLKKQAYYHNLEILNLKRCDLNTFSSIIENSGECLKKILFRPHDIIKCHFMEILLFLFHLIELENLLKFCKNLKSLLLNIGVLVSYERILKSGTELLKILVRSAPASLTEIRPALSILTIDSTYMKEDYIKLINKYKNDGVIKDFKYVPNIDEICYKP